LQTALIAMTEIGVSLLLSLAFLGESLTSPQWIGVGFLAASILLMRTTRIPRAWRATPPPCPTWPV
jgi:drug/metabolite transporter (DMT)-like permease